MKSTVSQFINSVKTLNGHGVGFMLNDRRIALITSMRDSKEGEGYVDGVCFHDCTLWNAIGVTPEMTRVLDWREDEPDIMQVHWYDTSCNYYVDGVCSEIRYENGEYELSVNVGARVVLLNIVPFIFMNH